MDDLDCLRKTIITFTYTGGSAMKAIKIAAAVFFSIFKLKQLKNVGVILWMRKLTIFFDP